MKKDVTRKLTSAEIRCELESSMLILACETDETALNRQEDLLTYARRLRAASQAMRKTSADMRDLAHAIRTHVGSLRDERE